MKDEDKTKDQLINELADLRQELKEVNNVAHKLEDFRSLYMKAPLPYQSLDENGRFISVNQAWVDTLGYSMEEVSGKWFGDFLDPNYIEKFEGKFPCFKKEGEVNCVEFKMVRKNGTNFILSLDGKISRDEKGNFKQTHCIFQDITERKQMEEKSIRLNEELEQLVTNRTVELNTSNEKLVQEIVEHKQGEEKLKKSENRFRSMFENHSAVMLLVEPDSGKILDSNNSATNFYGYTRKEITSMNISDINTLESEEVKKKRKLAEATEVNLFNFKHRLKDNTLRDVQVHSTPIEFMNQKILFSIVYDITEIKQAEKENERLQNQLQQAQKMESVGTLAGGIAHEFNNILGGILGYTEIAKEDASEDSSVRESLDQIFNLSIRARDVVKQILSFSRKGKKDLKPLHPHLIIEESLKVLRASIPTTIEIRQNINEQSGMILADHTQIHQTGINLCMNAAHAMEDKGGVLEVGFSSVVLDAEDLKPYPDLKTGEYVKLTVSDTGAGIDPNNIDKIFDPFFTTKEIGKGTGMGLSIVHGIIKDHGGVINVSSKLGEGTTFTIFLPKTEARINKTESDDALPTGTENILVVDDEEHLVFLLKKNMERLGYKVTAMTNSLETLELFKKDPHRYDLIITDLTMPHLTGDRLASKVTAIRPDMPVIIATGYADAIDSDKVKQSGIKAFIPKPYQKEELAKTIRLILD